MNNISLQSRPALLQPRAAGDLRAAKLPLAVLLAAILSAGANQACAQSYKYTDLGNGYAEAINNAGQITGYSLVCCTQNALLWTVRANGSVSKTSLTSLGGGSSQASAINSSGQVVGVSANAATGFNEAALWSSGTITDLTVQSGNSFYGASAINDAGLVAGSTANSQAAVWNGTTVSDLGTLGGSSSTANGINNAGQVVGYSYTAGSAGIYHATLWNGTTATDLGTLPGASGGSSIANAINNSGQIVGSSAAVPAHGVFASHATLWNGTSAIDLGTLGGNTSSANAINNAGQIVGNSFLAGNTVEHAVLWNGTTATDLNSFLSASRVSAGWVLVTANGINNNGWITGYAYNALTDAEDAFLLAPVPEPQTGALMLGGLGLIGLLMRRRGNAETARA